MIKIMLKKQMTEIFRNYFYDPKKGTAKSKGATIGGIIAYLILVVGVFGVMFGVLAVSMCAPCVIAGQDWIYFMIFAVIGVLLGIFGSVFSTYAELYLAKDNDQLLSLPIPVSAIMTSRLASVYLMGLLYSAGATLPAVIVYAVNVPFHPMTLIGSILFIFLISVFVMVLSCLLGWVVAKISTKLKRKGVVTALLAIGAFVIYYMVYGRSMAMINSLIRNVEEIGDPTGMMKVFWLIGSLAEGNILSILICTGVCAALFLVLWIVMKRSFIDIVTTKTAEKKTEYHETAAKQKSALQALCAKERARFFGSPTYMLNCGLGIVLLPALGIFLLVNGGTFAEHMTNVFGVGADGSAVLYMALICLVSAMDVITTPSVSLEGKNIWILRSLPLSAWDVLNGKLQTHLLFGIIPAAVAAICAGIASGASPLIIILMLLSCYMNVYLLGLFGLRIGLKHVNLKWSNENIPIKQSISVFLSMLSGWILAVIIGVPYLLLHSVISANVYLVIVILAEALLSLMLRNWMKTKGTEIFESLL